MLHGLKQLSPKSRIPCAPRLKATVSRDYDSLLCPLLNGLKRSLETRIPYRLVLTCPARWIVHPLHHTSFTLSLLLLIHSPIITVNFCYISQLPCCLIAYLSALTSPKTLYRPVVRIRIVSGFGYGCGSAFFDPLKIPLEMVHKVICTQQKNYLLYFQNSGTLIVI